MFYLSRTLTVGLFWGGLQAFGVAFPIVVYGNSPLIGLNFLAPPNSVPGFLVVFPLALSFVCGFVLKEFDRAIKSLLVSIMVTITLSVVILGTLQSPFSFLLPREQLILGILPVPLFLFDMIGSLLGVWFSTDMISSGVRNHRVQLDRHGVMSLALIFVTLMGTAVFAARVQSSLYESTINMQKEVYANDNAVAQWSNGTVNISISVGPLPIGSGVLRIQWQSTGTLSFHIEVLNANESATGDSAYLPFSSLGSSGSKICPKSICPVGTVYYDPIAWFHNENCSGSFCPGGIVYYSLEVWY